jgi:hypothetical protein
MPAEGFFLENAAIYALNPWHVLRFRKKVGYFPNIAFPTTYLEKVAWRKLFDRNPLFHQFCDKLATKDYIGRLAPDLPVAKTLWTGDRLTREAWDLLGEDTVLKSNHGSNRNFFPGKEKLSFAELEARTKRWMRTTYGRKSAENAYRGARKMLFVEERLKSPDTPLVDIGVRAANGSSISVWYYIYNKTPAQKIGYFTPEGERIRAFDALVKPHEVLDAKDERREPILKCVEWAKRLSKGVDYARFDFLVAGEAIYGGEITLYSMAGLSNERSPAEKAYGALLSSSWDLRQSHFFRDRHGLLLERYRSRLLENLDRAAAAGDAALL